MSRSRSYVFTLNNYTKEEEDRVQSMDCQYLIYGREKGAQGTPHLQGMVYFKLQKSFNAVKKLMQRAHLEVCRDVQASIVYCKKEGDVFEKGVPPMSQFAKGEAEKNRWKRARELANAGKFDEIDDELYVRYQKSFKMMFEDHQPKPESIPVLDFWWFKGPSGSGKSRTAREENPDHYLKAPNKWWDGYKGEPCVIIDEWSPHHNVLADHLKRWADHHPFVAEIKGGTRVLRPKKIIVTSNYDMGDCFPNMNDLGPIERRFKVRLFPENK